MRYSFAGLLVDVVGPELSAAIEKMPGFSAFKVVEGEVNKDFEGGAEGHVVFCMSQPYSIPTVGKLLYQCETPENGTIFFHQIDGGYLLRVLCKDSYVPGVDSREILLWSRWGEREVFISGSLFQLELKFALWIGFGLVAVRYGVGAIHSSCIVAKGRAVLFLGESGTGKSTHTRLWIEGIEGAELLNDDSPLVRLEDGKVYVYGSPWSGKTHCYRQERYPLAGCVRLSQAPYNKIVKLPVIKAYGALHPSFPPEFAYSEQLYGKISEILSAIISVAPCWHLECLPNVEAAQLSYSHCIG